jgi:uncharacterized protein
MLPDRDSGTYSRMFTDSGKHLPNYIYGVKTSMGHDEMNGGQNEEKELERGIALFNSGDYFQAHEVWEDWWRATTRPGKRTIQSMIQTAVAMHHASTGNWDGAKSVMQRALRNLDGAGEMFCGVDLKRLREDMRRAVGQFESKETVTRFKILRG